MISSKYQRAIIETIAYSDFYDYPLTIEEIWRYLPVRAASMDDVRNALSGQKVVEQSGKYYHLPGRGQIVLLREERARLAAEKWKEALKYGRLLSWLPFVRMLCVTGSLAMNNVADAGDIDWMIVTANDRLWLCRAMVLLVARLAALQGVRLCPNYLVSASALSLPEKSLYSAHELTQMVPIFGLSVYKALRAENGWAEEFLPNAAGRPAVYAELDFDRPLMPVNFLRRLEEAVLASLVGTWLENWEMRRKIKKLRGEQQDSLESDFGKDWCKGHSMAHGAKLRGGFRERLQATRVEVSK